MPKAFATLISKQLDTINNVPVIANVSMTSANTEYSYTFPENTGRFLIQCRTDADIKFAFASGESGTTYLTLKGNNFYWEETLSLTKNPTNKVTIYFQSASAGLVLEILSWT